MVKLVMGMPFMRYLPANGSQSVIFPQEKQPGKAKVSKKKNVYQLSNKLLTAKFELQDGRILFAGSDELGLKLETEIFKIRLGDGKEIKASEMTLKDVRIATLKGNAQAVKGVKRFNGKAIEADFAYGDLDIAWRAVLRDGSHYLRTEMDVTRA
ncbi:MAG: hypothetical protein J6B31_05565 [Bacteroidaceae bacterium]|nr:hypothetical protein [Bacteroidaceae bacterium]